ncbi:hypothetical protein [Paenibacillus sp. AR247]|uniref:hypothetical protein n=1 Tax=Paenibacillus sp. AR247 TaxID=1631599 RepID=UPI00280B3B0E|nr:hypothetical protein [Paenibacillus sp. AR247]
MNETLSVQGYAGAGLVLLGVALSELNVSRLLGRRSSRAARLPDEMSVHTAP